MRCAPALVALFCVALASATTGFAAPDAGAKARGDYGFYNRATHNALSSARSHVETYQRYLNDTHGIPLPAHDAPHPALPPAAVAVERPAAPAAAPAPIADHATQIATHGPVDEVVAREASDAIADDIERIQRHVTRMREQATTLDDREALKTLTDIEGKLGVARRGHAALHEHHAGESIAAATAMDLAQKVNDALRAAHAEHDTLMRRLPGKAASPAR
ncbi:MAG: hypothetical protein EBR86_10520 [Planctomycetia bacterium]|nr:hypothetical protein [Planctomycetia bacterium]